MANKCSKCGTAMRQDTLTRDVTVAGVPFVVRMPGEHCPNGDSWSVSNEAAREMDRLVLRSIATRGPATGQTFKYMRGSLKLKAAELAELLGVTAETVSRWETGAVTMTPLPWVTVAAMALDQLDGRATTTKRLRAATARDVPVESRELSVEVRGAA